MLLLGPLPSHTSTSSDELGNQHRQFDGIGIQVRPMMGRCGWERERRPSGIILFRSDLGSSRSYPPNNVMPPATVHIRNCMAPDKPHELILHEDIISITVYYAIVLPGRISGFRAAFRKDSRRESLKLSAPAGLRPAGGPILKLSRLESGRNLARKPISGPEALLRNIGY